MNYLSELKRRNIFKVAVAYLMMSWVILQIIDVITPVLFLPEFFARIVFVLLAILFPITLIITWAFELTPEGVKKTTEVDVEESIRATTGQKINYIIIGLMAIAITFLLYDRSSNPEEVIVAEAPAPVELENTIAVMPFSDMSEDGSQEYFGDGIAEEILNVLIKIDELDVTSRTSAFALKNQNLLIPEIAERLNVNYILEGSIRTAGENVRVTAQLIDVATDRHLWSNTFDRELTSIFAIQDEISSSIAEALKIEVIGDELLRKAPTTNIEAYDLYLRGHELFLARGPQLEQAVLLLEQAVELDENFAEAWADLAFVHRILPTSKYQIEVALPKARAAIDRAINLNPNLSHAWAVKGLIHQAEFEIVDAELAVNRAIELNPNNESAWLWRALFYGVVGDFGQEERSVERAIEIAPDVPISHHYLAAVMSRSGQTERAKEILEKSIYEMGYEEGRLNRANIALIENDPERAINEIIAFGKARRTGGYSEATIHGFNQFIKAFYNPSLREDALKLLVSLRENGEVVPLIADLILQNGEGVITRIDGNAFDRMGVFSTLYNPINRGMLNQQVVKDYIIEHGLLEYWQNNQFPYFCRPVGEGDFECQDGEGNWP